MLQVLAVNSYPELASCFPTIRHWIVTAPGRSSWIVPSCPWGKVAVVAC